MLRANVLYICINVSITSNDRQKRCKEDGRSRNRKVEWENSIWVLKQMSVHTVTKSQAKTQKKPREHFKINSGEKPHSAKCTHRLDSNARKLEGRSGPKDSHALHSLLCTDINISPPAYFFTDGESINFELHDK